MAQKNTFHNEKLALDIGRQTAQMLSKCKAADLPQVGDTADGSNHEIA